MEPIKGTTILSVRRSGKVVIGGDGQVSMGNTVIKGNARKVRRLYKDKVIAGFAGGTADAFTLFELFEGKLEQYGNLTRAAIELAKDWRTDRRLRRLEALLCVADDLAVTGAAKEAAGIYETFRSEAYPLHVRTAAYRGLMAAAEDAEAARKAFVARQPMGRVATASGSLSRARLYWRRSSWIS